MSNEFANLVKTVAQNAGDERGAKCGYDLLMGLEQGDVEDRARAWIGWLRDKNRGDATTETERNGVWVPAIPLKFKKGLLAKLLSGFKCGKLCVITSEELL